METRADEPGFVAGISGCEAKDQSFRYRKDLG